jgi:O-antigen/teichoic acid export membrane protein
MGPFWSAFTEAYVKKDISWIKSAMLKLRWVSFIGIGLIIIMVLVSGIAYKVWIGDQVSVPLSITIAQAILTIVNTLTMPYMFFMNGTGKIFLQTIISLFGILLFLPLAFFFAKATNWGPGGIIAASIICNLPMLVLYPIHYYKTLTGNSTGIWK